LKKRGRGGAEKQKDCKRHAMDGKVFGVTAICNLKRGVGGEKD